VTDVIGAISSSELTAWITAISTGVLALLGIGALLQIRQTAKTRATEVMMELGRRWDSPEMIRCRAEVNELADSRELEKVVVHLYEERNERYYQLMQEPGYLQDLGVIYFNGGISTRILFGTMGLQVGERWQKWKPAIEALGDVRKAKFHFAAFREMGEQLSSEGKCKLHHIRNARKDLNVKKFRQANLEGELSASSADGPQPPRRASVPID
jgi:hypothetical protein